MNRCFAFIGLVIFFFSCESRKENYLERLANQHVVTTSIHISAEIINPIEENWFKFNSDLIRMAYMEQKSLDEINSYVLNSINKLDPHVRQIIVKTLVCANCVKYHN